MVLISKVDPKQIKKICWARKINCDWLNYLLSIDYKILIRYLIYLKL